jgi:hypothetical protein
VVVVVVVGYRESWWRRPHQIPGSCKKARRAYPELQGGLGCPLQGACCPPPPRAACRPRAAPQGPGPAGRRSGFDFLIFAFCLFAYFTTSKSGLPSHFERATHEQQTSGRRSLISQIKHKPESWTTAAAFFFFLIFNLASARLLAPITVPPASTSFANPAFSYLAVVLVSALRGFQSPEGEETEISLL